MSGSFELNAPEVFTVGTVGDPGQRVFFLQAREGEVCVSLKCEKEQVRALSEYLDALLDDLEPSLEDAAAVSFEVSEPVIAEWIVGSIGVAYDEPTNSIVVVFEEVVDEDAGEEGATTKIRLSRPQVAGFVERGRALVAAGRPACRLCGFPIDPDGHPCPRYN